MIEVMEEKARTPILIVEMNCFDGIKYIGKSSFPSLGEEEDFYEKIISKRSVLRK